MRSYEVKNTYVQFHVPKRHRNLLSSSFSMKYIALEWDINIKPLVKVRQSLDEK